MGDSSGILSIAYSAYVAPSRRCGFYLDFDGASFGAVGRALDELRSWWRGDFEYISHSWGTDVGSSVKFSARVLLLFEEDVTADYYDESLRAAGVVDKLMQLMGDDGTSSITKTSPEPQKEERRLGAYSLMIE